MSDRTYIPVTDKEVVQALAARIRAIYRDNGKAYYVKPGADLFNQSFLWNAEADGEAGNDLVHLRDITTYHTYGYYGFFKPSIAEVMAQINQLPPEEKAKVYAFELTTVPETASDLNEEQRVTNAGYHKATARLYEKNYALNRGDFIRVRANHANTARAGMDGMVAEASPASCNTVGLTFGCDRTNTFQNVNCVGIELWNKSELDSASLSK